MGHPTGSKHHQVRYEECSASRSVGVVWKPPYIAKTHSIPDACQEEGGTGAPRLPLCHHQETLKTRLQKEKLEHLLLKCIQSRRCCNAILKPTTAQIGWSDSQLASR